MALANSMQVFHRRLSSSPTCIRLENDSMTALLNGLPTDLIDGTSPESVVRWVNAQDVYWADSTGRRNTLSVRSCDGREETSAG